MRTTIDLPDAVFRETKALAAMRGITMKQFILEAIELAKSNSSQPKPGRARKFPSIHLRSRRTLDLDNFNFDDLLA